MRRTQRSLLGLALIVLAACSTPPAATVVTVEFASHQDGQVVTGSRQVEIVALVNAPADAEVAGEHNGQDVAFTRNADSLRATVTLEDGQNDFEITVTFEDKSATDSLMLVYPFVRLDDGQEGSLVIGQADEFSAADDAPVGMRMLEPYTRPAFIEGKLFIPDSGTHRVLAFDGVPTATGALASFVIGQPDFDELTKGIGPGGLNEPGMVLPYKDGIVVMDTQNNRILVFDDVPNDFNATADRVLGQADFVTDTPSCTATTFTFPDSAAFAGDRFIVADTDNHRVLIWNQFPADADTPADIVLGQESFTSCDSNAGGSASASTLHTPQSVWTDGTRLIVADTGNHRVLVWNQFPTSDFEPADVVIGQPDFATTAPGLDAQSFNWPAFLDSNGNQLFVADADNHRVLVWDAIPTANHEPADHVLGQPDMTSGLINQGMGVGPETLNTPSGVYFLDGKLFVADLNNHRYVVFETIDD